MELASAIRSMTPGDTRRLVSGCVASIGDPAAVADLVAGIDWSDTGTANAEVARIAGRLEGVVTLLGEGDLTRDQAATELRDLLTTRAAASG